jgi:hypothetical protein
MDTRRDWANRLCTGMGEISASDAESGSSGPWQRLDPISTVLMQAQTGFRYHYVIAVAFDVFPLE